MQKMVSIIVPCYNVAKFLPDFFSGIDNQIYKNFEVIFVDDGSTDNTLAVLEEYCKAKERAVVISQKNLGPSAARNAGAAVAKGEFLAFVDADDMLASDYLKVLTDGIEGVDIAICGYKWVKEKTSYKKVKSSGKGTSVSRDTEQNLCQLLSGRKYSFCVWNKLYRKDIFQQIGGFDPNIFYGEDLCMNFKYFSQTKSVRLCKRKVYFYRHRKGGIVRSKFKTNFLTVSRAADVMIDKSLTKKVENHARGFKCLSCTEMLFRIYKSDFCDKNAIKSLLSGMKQNRMALFKSDKCALYRRLLIPITYPILWCISRKKLK